MKILVVLPRIPVPVRDGGSRVMMSTLRQLGDMGHEVHVVALNTSRHPSNPELLQPYVTSAVAVPIDTMVRPLAALRAALRPRLPQKFSHNGTVPYWVTRFASAQALDSVLAVAGAGDVGVVLVESLFCAPYAEAVKHLLASNAPPIVLHAHNVEHHIQELLASDQLRSFPQRVYRRMLARQTRDYEQHVASIMDAVITLTDEDKQWFLAHSSNEQRIVHIQPGIEVPNLPVVQIPANLSLGFLGALDWEPNVDAVQWFAYNVLPRIWEQLPGVAFHVAGRGRSAAIEALHDGQKIVVHGEVENPAITMQQWSVVVAPIRSGSGVRIKILEAMAAGCAVVTTTLGCQGIDVVDGRHLRMADTAEAFAQACCSLLQNSAAARQMGQNARSVVQNTYSTEQSSIRLAELLQQVMSAKRQAPEVG